MMSSFMDGDLKKQEKDERKAEKREAKRKAMLMRRINEQVQPIRIQAIGLVLAFAVLLALSSSLNADILRRFLNLVEPVPLGLRTAEENKFRSFAIQTYHTYAIQTYPNKCSYRISMICGHLNCLGEMLNEAIQCLDHNDTIIYHHEPSQYHKYDLVEAILESKDEDFWFDKNNILTRAAILIFRRIENQMKYMKSEMKMNILIMAYIQRFFYLLDQNDFNLDMTVTAWKYDCITYPQYDELKSNVSIFDIEFEMSDEPTAIIWFSNYDLNKIYLICPRNANTIAKTIQFVHKMHNQPNYVLAINGERRPLQKAITFLIRKHLYNDYYEKAIRYQQPAYYDYIESKYICQKNADIVNYLKSIGIECEQVELNDVEEEDVHYSFILYHPPTHTFFSYENNVMVDGV